MALKIVGFFPVIHRGYTNLLARYPDADVCVLDNTIFERFTYLKKDIRRLEASEIVLLLHGLKRNASLISVQRFTNLLKDETEELVLFDDDISHQLVEEYSPKARIRFESAFLRWDRSNTTSEHAIQNVAELHERELGHHVTAQLYDEAAKSSDWWRHVAAGFIQNGKLIAYHNNSNPHEYSVWIDGDPRITTHQGADLDVSVFSHAEATLIASCARNGIETQEKELFVTTFPCSNCARLIAAAGFSACYFIEGYANLDGQRILETANVKIIRIITEISAETNPNRLIPYKR